jgi:hypothetical protein
VPPLGLPLWAVLVIVGGTITLAAGTTLITLALHPTATRGPCLVRNPAARSSHHFAQRKRNAISYSKPS